METHPTNIMASIDLGLSIQALKHECFLNAALACQHNPSYQFVYGWIVLTSAGGVMVAEHCWLLNSAEEIVDPTGAVFWLSLMQHATYFTAALYPGDSITLDGYTMPCSNGIPVNVETPAKLHAMTQAYAYVATLRERG